MSVKTHLSQGAGSIKRARKMADGSTKSESKPCQWADDDGEPINCATITTDETTFLGQGHGWMTWESWGSCTKTCNSGVQTRRRACGTCANPDQKTGLCDENDISLTDALVFFRANLDHCVEGHELETQPCSRGFCLPRNTGLWKNTPNNRPFALKSMWSLAPKETWANNFAEDYVGGCVDYSSAYKKVKLDSRAYGNFHNARTTFAECLRVCQVEEKNDCLSVTYFSSTKFYADGEFNCFLHNKRCHEDSEFRSATFVANLPGSASVQDKATSWYAFKDLCNAPKAAINPCNYMGTYYQAACDSSGDKAFPNPNVCSCPNTGDKNSELRTFGNPSGKFFYDSATGLMTKKTTATTNAGNPLFPLFYSKNKYNNILGRKNLEDYEEYVKSGIMACHSKF
jgi:hypothetical protein